MLISKNGINGDFIWLSNFPNAYNGYDSVGASANIGKAILDVATERIARIFKDTQGRRELRKNGAKTP